MTITLKYEFGDIVYLKTDPDQLERMVTRAIISPNGVLYEVTCGTTASTHYEMEMTEHRDIKKQLNIPQQ